MQLTEFEDQTVLLQFPTWGVEQHFVAVPAVCMEQLQFALPQLVHLNDSVCATRKGVTSWKHRLVQ